MNKEEIINILIKNLDMVDYIDVTKYLSSLEEENKQLKDNWNKLKNIVKSQSDLKQKLYNDRLYFEVDEILDKMQELESGGSNE